MANRWAHINKSSLLLLKYEKNFIFHSCLQMPSHSADAYHVALRYRKSPVLSKSLFHICCKFFVKLCIIVDIAATIALVAVYFYNAVFCMMHFRDCGQICEEN